MHGHNHAHEHRELTVAGNRRRLFAVLSLTTAYLVAEVIGGVMTNSLALLSDAGHMLTDVGALALALLAIRFAERPADPRRSYGYYRLEILAALANGVTLLVITVFVIYEAIRRLSRPPEVGGLGLLVIASGGLLVNVISAYVLMGGHQHSLNVRAAFYHVIGDALGSLAAVIAGILVLTMGWTIADPLLAIVISLLIAYSALGLVRESVDVLLEATPTHIDIDALRQSILNIDGVEGLHDLHIWTITSGLYALSCHVVVTDDAFTVAKLEELRLHLYGQCGIAHLTVQLETEILASEEDIHL